MVVQKSNFASMNFLTGKKAGQSTYYVFKFFSLNAIILQSTFFPEV